MSEEQEDALIGQICGWMKSDAMLAFGPGHVVFDDYNLHSVDWCIEENKKAIIDRLNDGRVVDGQLAGDNYEFLSVIQLAQSLEYLYLLQTWIGEYEAEMNDERMG